MKILRRVFALACIAVLLSCGGGLVAINGGGVGTGGTGIAAGTVTGLGSVIVDGVRYDESQAALESLPDLVHAQTLTLADLQVGQYVYLTLDAAGNPTQVRVDSQLVGPAAVTAVMGGQFSVWGQRVVVNTDPTQGPVTVFSGYQSVADVHAGDPVQVYGVLQSSDSGSDVIRATRIERLAAAGALPARVTGTLHAGAGGTLLLAGVPLDASAMPAAPSLAAGQAVTIIVPWTQNPASWQAAAVALLAPAAGTSLQVSGTAHLLPDGSALVQGVRVDLSTLAPNMRQEVQEGHYVTVEGSSSSDDGTRAVASAVVPVPQAGWPAQLRGSITSVSGTTSFVLRGQQVDASNALFVNGTPASLAAGVYVEVQGRQTANLVVATQVTFSATPPTDAVLEVTGTVQSVDAGTRRVHMTTEDGQPLDLVLAPGMALPSVGRTVQAAGYWSGGLLIVRDLESE